MARPLRILVPGGWYHVTSRGNRQEPMYVAVRHGRQRLADVVRAIGDIRYGAAAQAVRRFGAGLEKDRSKRRFVESLKRRLSS